MRISLSSALFVLPLWAEPRFKAFCFLPFVIHPSKKGWFGRDGGSSGRGERISRGKPSIFKFDFEIGRIKSNNVLENTCKVITNHKGAEKCKQSTGFFWPISKCLLRGECAACESRLSGAVACWSPHTGAARPSHCCCLRACVNSHSVAVAKMNVHSRRPVPWTGRACQRTVTVAPDSIVYPSQQRSRADATRSWD